ncbi:MAG TPA: CBS domain-containing protein [Methanosarcinales archaeon]|nr:CBS domain-containing protein [Methanosarcinales archaeon]
MNMKIYEKLIRDVMTRGVVTVSTETLLKDIAEKMTTQHLSGVAVIGEHGDVLGFISEMDVLKVLDKPNPEQLSAEDVISPHLIAIAPNATLRQAARVMNERRTHRLLILSEKGVGASQRPVGILSASDIIREVAQAGQSHIAH